MIQSFTPQLTVRLSLIAVLALGPTFVLHAESEAKKSIAATTNEASASSRHEHGPRSLRAGFAFRYRDHRLKAALGRTVRRMTRTTPRTSSCSV